jgi:tRNA A37 threonylcarbamoyladenosine dehydratase
MIFNEYLHMDNDYKILKYDKILEIIQSDNMEKIYGTNFSFITDGIDMVCCRSSDILKHDENFYSYKNILSK